MSWKRKELNALKSLNEKETLPFCRWEKLSKKYSWEVFCALP